MFNQHPYILERLFEIRAEEFQQRATEQRLLTRSRTNRGQWRQKLAQLGSLFLTRFPYGSSQPSRQRSMVANPIGSARLR